MLNPLDLFQGPILFIVPHMDDEALACGGIIAQLPQKEKMYFVYATNGMKSPAPIFPSRDRVTVNLGEVRRQEAITAMGMLGIPEENLQFLNLPEANLCDNLDLLSERLRNIIIELMPDHIFIPFRYDRHPDHLSINRVITEARKKGHFSGQIIEYFVYYRWKLMPAKDIRKYIKPEHLLKMEIHQVAQLKRKALDCYQSQTTIYFPWQTRPILTPVLLNEECQNPEIFLVYDPSFPGPNIFTKGIFWIRIVHQIEPVLKKWKYLAGALLKRFVSKLAGYGKQ